MSDIPGLTADAYAVTVDSINEAGQVVGTSVPHSNLVERAFLWERGHSNALSLLPSSFPEAEELSAAHGLNNRGQIVGKSGRDGDPSTRRAVLWTDGEIVDVNTLVASDRNVTLTNAIAINDCGQIIGSMYQRGFVSSTPQKGYLLTPVEAGSEHNERFRSRCKSG